MTYDEAMKLAEEVFDEEYSGLDKDSFLIGFQEAYNAIMALCKDKFELVKRMRGAQEELDVFEHEHDFFEYEVIMKRKELTSKVIKLESEVDEWLEKTK